MRVLGLIGALPDAAAPTGVPRALALLRLLRDAGHDVELAVGEPLTGTRAALGDLASTAIGGPVSAVRGAQRLPADTTALRWALPLRLAAEHATPLARHARALATSVDLVLGLDPAGNGAASAISGDVATVLDLVPLQGVTAGGDWARTSRERWLVQPGRSWERRIVARGMGLIAPSAEARHRADRLYYRRPAVVPTPVIAPPAAPAEAVSGEHTFTVGWFGDATDPAERAGLEWLSGEIWPRVGDRSAHLVLADAARPRTLSGTGAADGVRLLRPDAGLVELAAECTLAIRPVRRAGGDGAATIALMAAGLPVVGTPQAFEGTSLRAGLEGLIADDPAGLAAALRRLAADSASTRRIAAQGQQHVLRHHSPDAVTAALEDAIAVARRRFADYRAGRVPNPLDPAGVKRELDGVLAEAKAAGRTPGAQLG